MKLLYDVIYRFFRAPWDIGARPELVNLVESGKIKPGRAIDLGSGTASNVIFLAQHGFNVTGIDFSLPAVEKGRKMASENKVKAAFFQDNLTRLSRDYGTFDLLVDYGTFDDLSLKNRQEYLRNILPLTKAGSRFLIFVFEWPLRWWEKLKNYHFALEPGEIKEFFGEYFNIERIARFTPQNPKEITRGNATYLMIRKINR